MVRGTQVPLLHKLRTILSPWKLLAVFVGCFRGTTVDQLFISYQHCLLSVKRR